MQYYTSKDMYANKYMESQVSNDYTYRWNSVSEVLSEGIRLSIYFRFKVLNTLQKSTSIIFGTELFIVYLHARKLA